MKRIENIQKDPLLAKRWIDKVNFEKILEETEKKRAKRKR